MSERPAPISISYRPNFGTLNARPGEFSKLTKGIDHCETSHRENPVYRTRYHTIRCENKQGESGIWKQYFFCRYRSSPLQRGRRENDGTSFVSYTSTVLEPNILSMNDDKNINAACSSLVHCHVEEGYSCLSRNIRVWRTPRNSVGSRRTAGEAISSMG